MTSPPASKPPSRAPSPVPPDVEDQPQEQEQPQAPAAQPEYLEGLTLALVTIGLALASFCMGLDRSILATAIPKITSEFNSVDDVAWYGSAYLLTTCAFQLPFGKLYAEFTAKWVFIAALVIFEIGSIVAAAAPSSVALIIGRAIQGVGCAGAMTGGMTILALALPIHKRPAFGGILAGVSGISQIVAPALGGVLTDRATWRWCFWINLPLGGVTVLVVLLFVKLPPKPASTAFTDPAAFVRKLDPVGTVLLMPSLVCLLLSLQWGGFTYSWSNWRIILCFVLFGVLAIVWFYLQYREGDAATLPLRIARQRSIAAGMLFLLCATGSLFIVVYYVPIWFQSVRRLSAEDSGVNFLAAMGAMTVSVIFGGVFATKSGYYVPQMIVSSVLTSIAAGLIYRYDADTSTAYWAGTLVMFGFGTGLGITMPLTAAQVVLQPMDIPIGISVLNLVQTLGGAVFLAVGQNLFQAELLRSLPSTAPDVDPNVVVDTGVTDLGRVIEDRYGSDALDGVLVAYNNALQDCFLVCIILSCLTVIGTVFMEWKNVKEESAKAAANKQVDSAEVPKSSQPEEKAQST